MSRISIIMILVFPETSTYSWSGENSTSIWTETPYGSVFVEEGDCPAGRALLSYGEIVPDLTDLILRILQKGDSVVDIGVCHLLDS